MATGQSQNPGVATMRRQMKVKYNKIGLKDLEFEKGDKVWVLCKVNKLAD